ncbi:MAG: sporulation peptidase YabG [Bacillaceae bacterium]
MDMKVGDFVSRKSYQFDLIFRIMEFRTKNGIKEAILHGENLRLIADAPVDDLVVMNEREYVKRLKVEREKIETALKVFRQNFQLVRQQSEYIATGNYASDIRYFQMPGKVLHLDGDPLYLKKCLDMYNKMGITVQGLYYREEEMPEKIGGLIDYYNPDILIITGHDAYSSSKGKMSDLRAYRHSKYFIEAVKEARKKAPSLDQLVIFAGACQSHFEGLIQAGANFASSPTRVNIHALDPVYIVGKVCYTPFMDKINIWDVIRGTITGEKGLGGVETRGIMRTGIPYYSFEE